MAARLLPEPQKQFVDSVVKDLQAHHGAAVVIPGENQPPAVHALAHAMNQALGAVGNTVVYTDPVEAKPMDQLAALKELVSDMNAGKVDMLLIVGSNPVYDAPQDFAFRRCDGQGSAARAAQHISATKPASSATGTSTPRTIWSNGVMRALSMEPSA